MERQVSSSAVWFEPYDAVVAVDHAPSLPLSQAEVPTLFCSPAQEERRKKKKKKTAVGTPVTGVAQSSSPVAPLPLSAANQVAAGRGGPTCCLRARR